MQEQISLTIRSRYPILYLVSWEEERVERQLRQIAEDLKKKLYVWSATDGFVPDGEGSGDGIVEPQAAVKHVLQSADRALYLLKDFHLYLDRPEILRLLRDVAATLDKSYKTLLLLSPILKVPVELEKDLAVIDIPLPTEKELGVQLRELLESVGKNPKVKVALTPALEEKVIKAARGLTEREAERVFAKSVVNNMRFDEDDLQLIIEEKRQIIRKTELLEYYELQEELQNVGGVGALKEWLEERRAAFSSQAREYGLPEPKGLLLLGVQGCGKSLMAKSIASLWKLPLLRMDVGSLFSSYIGQSEANMRRATKIAESLSPCVLWLDEIEKAFSGLNEGGGDAGTTKRVLASFLVWMQEKREPVFIVATANSIKALPPEFMRKGRFDEIFFVDLPDAKEREEIFGIHLKKRKRAAEKFSPATLAGKTEGFSGAEIEQAIVAAMYSAFSQQREFTAADIEREIKRSVPISVTMGEDIRAQREWSKSRARMAR